MIRCRNVCLTNAKLLDLLAEVLSGSTPEIIRHGLRAWVVRSKNDFCSGVVENLPTEVVHSLACDDDRKAVLPTLFHQLRQRDVIGHSMCLVEHHREWHAGVL